MVISKIHDKIRSGKKLTKPEEKELEEYDNTHTDTEFNLIIGLNRDMTSHEKRKVIEACLATIKGLGYEEVDML